jgi:signal transduction histidine kinase
MELVIGYNLIPQLRKTRTKLIILVVISLAVFLFIQSTLISSISTESLYNRVQSVSKEYELLSYIVEDEDNKFRFLIYSLTFGLWMSLSALCWILLNFILHPVSEIIKQREQFILNARHELRTPLTILQSEIEQLNVEQLDQKGQLEVLGISQQISRLTDLSQNLLTSLTNQDIQSNTQVDVKEIITTLDTQLSKIYRTKNIRLNNNLPTILYSTNQSLFIQLLTNLIENIYKHSAPNSEYILESDGDSILFTNHFNTPIKNQSKTIGVIASTAIAKQLNLTIDRSVVQNRYITKIIGIAPRINSR